MATPASRTTRKAQDIVGASIDLFRRFGMKRVSVTEICETAKVSKATFYKYFPNKVELFKHVLDVMSDEILDRVDEIRDMDIPFVEKIQLWIDQRTQLASELSPELFEELYHADEELRGFVAERSHKNMAHFLGFIRDGQERGEIRSSIKPEFILTVLHRLNDLGRDERLVAMYPSWAELTKEVQDFFFYGILAR